MDLPRLVLMAVPRCGTWTGAPRPVQARGGGGRANLPPVLTVSPRPGRGGAGEAGVRRDSEEAGASRGTRDKEETEDEETRNVPNLSVSAVMGQHQTLQGGKMKERVFKENLNLSFFRDGRRTPQCSNGRKAKCSCRKSTIST